LQLSPVLGFVLPLARQQCQLARETRRWCYSQVSLAYTRYFCTQTALVSTSLSRIIHGWISN
jgi:hypothetical protein